MLSIHDKKLLILIMLIIIIIIVLPYNFVYPRTDQDQSVIVQNSDIFTESSR